MIDLIVHKTIEFSLYTLAKYVVFTLPVFVLFYRAGREYFKACKIQDRQAKTKDFIREIGNSSLSSVVMTGIFVLVVYTPLHNHTRFRTEHFSLLQTIVTVLIALVIHDTYFYWMHRLLHHPRIFRHIHLTHHRSVNPSPFASYSFHALEAVAEALVIPVVLMVLPMDLLTIWMFLSASLCINVYGHLGYEVMPLWFRKTWMFEILNTSTHHNLHHSHFKGNYGLYFRFWDRVMGTENPGYGRAYDRVNERRKAGRYMGQGQGKSQKPEVL